MARLDEKRRGAILECLSALGFGAPDLDRRLWQPTVLRTLRDTCLASARSPEARLELALIEFDIRPTAHGSDPLMTLLRHALSLKPDDALAALIRGIDPRRPLALNRREGQHDWQGKELTVHLEAQDEQVRVSWHVGGRTLGLLPRVYPAEHLDAPAPAALMYALFPPLRDDTVPSDAVLPDPAPVMRAIGPSPIPSAYHMRLRLCLDHPGWAALPWDQLAWDGGRLVDGQSPWTVEIVRRVDPRIDVALRRVPDVVVLEDADSGDPLTADGVRAALTVASRDYARASHVTAAEDLDALPERLAARRRALVVARGLDAAALTRLGDLLTVGADAWGAPSALCLVGGPPTPPLDLLDRFPVVIRAPDVDAAKGWLRAVLLEGTDPVIAAHAEDPDAPGCARRAHPICTAYATWTPGKVRRWTPPPPALVLDRIAQRNRVMDRLRLMLGPDAHHHMVVFVASGPPENRVELLGEQLEEHIADLHPDLHLEVLRPALPRSGGYHPDHPEAFHTAAVGHCMQVDVGYTAAGLARQLAKGHLRGTRRIVWLDWGTFGHDPAREALSLDELRIWLEWHMKLAAAARDADVRAAAFIACQANATDLIEQEVKAAVRKTDLTCVDFATLDPLKAVKLDELRTYLNTPRFSRVDPKQVGRLTRALDDQVPTGHFEQLVGWLERGLRIGWPDLLAHLERPTPARPDGKRRIT